MLQDDGLPLEEEELELDSDDSDGSEEEEQERERSNNKKKRSMFVDDAAEEDEDDRRQKRNRFIDDIADVDEEEDEEEGDYEGIDDLFEEGEAPTAADLAEVRRAHREADRKLAEEEDLNPEEIQKYIKERFGKQRYAAAALGENEFETTEVRQQTLVPTVKDPKLWVIKCVENMEKELCICLLQKSYDFAARGTPLLIKSVFCQDHLKGHIYVEAYKEAHVRDALKGLRGVFHSKPPRLVPLNEMVDAVTVPQKHTRSIVPGSWVRMKSGVYKGDLGKVLAVEQGSGRATVQLIPRLDYAAMAAKQNDPKPAKGFPKAAKKNRPPARTFNPEEAKRLRLNMHYHRDRITGKDTYTFNLNKTDRYYDGYLVKPFSLKGMTLELEMPPLDELQRFNGAAQGQVAAADDLASLVQNLATDGTEDGGGNGGGGGLASLAPPTTKFIKGDNIVVTEGDLKDVRGIVEQITEDGSQILVKPTDESLLDLDEAIPFRPSELAKFFQSGSHVKIMHGQYQGQTGMVIRVEGPACIVFTDTTRQEAKVFSRDLVEAVAVASSIDSIGEYDLFDFVALDASTVGVIVGVDKDSCRVLTNQGRPDRPDIRICRLPDLKRKIDSRRTGTQDGARNDVHVKDIVEVLDGVLKGKNGTVRHIMRGFLFIQSREIADNGGYACVQARHCKVRGGRNAKLASYGGVLATPGRPGGIDPTAAPMYGGMGGGVMGGGGVGGRGGYGQHQAQSGRITTHKDRLLEGKEVVVRKGPYRGLKGRIVSATATHVRVELEAQMRTVTVDRAHIPEDGAAGGMMAGRPMMMGGMQPPPYGARGPPGPSAGPPTRTPAHPGIMATPGHPGMMGTPFHDGNFEVGKTPAYDAAWATTPGYTGFGGGGGGAAPMEEEEDFSYAEHWIGCVVEVTQGGKDSFQGVVESLDKGSAVVGVLEEGGGGRKRRAEVVKLDDCVLVKPGTKDRIKMIKGESAGLLGSLVAISNVAYVVKLDNGSSKVLDQAMLAKYINPR